MYDLELVRVERVTLNDRSVCVLIATPESLQGNRPAKAIAVQYTKRIMSRAALQSDKSKPFNLHWSTSCGIVVSAGKALSSLPEEPNAIIFTEELADFGCIGLPHVCYGFPNEYQVGIRA